MIRGLDDGLDVNNDISPPSQNVPMVRPSDSRSRHRLGRLQPFDTSNGGILHLVLRRLLSEESHLSGESPFFRN